MTLRRIISDAVAEFNQRQVVTGRDRLNAVESNMLVSRIVVGMQEYIASIRNELEDAAVQAELETQRDLEWATDIIIATLVFEGKDETTIRADEIAKSADGRKLKIEHDQGHITLKVLDDRSS